MNLLLLLTSQKSLLVAPLLALKQYPSKNLRVAINSNLGLKEEVLEKLINITHDIDVKEFDLYTSNESYGEHAEYIRDGLKYERWRGNVVRILEEAKCRQLIIMMTINSLCLSSITEFMDEILKFKKKHDISHPTMSLNILRFPSFQSCAMLPMEIRQKYSEKIQLWLNQQIKLDLRTSSGEQILNPIEREQTQRLVDYLDIIKTPHKNVKDPEQNKRDFKQFYTQYDQRRGKNFTQAFPNLAEWYNSL